MPDSDTKRIVKNTGFLYMRMLVMMTEKRSTTVKRKQSHREVKGIGQVYAAGRASLVAQW